MASWNRIASAAKLSKSARKKASRKKHRAKLLAVIAIKLAQGEQLPPEAVDYARRCGQGAPPNVSLSTGQPMRAVGAATKPKRNSFYSSIEWRRARYKALERHGARCQCCGATAADGAKINVDHIVPISKAWDRRLDQTNLQVLCGSCNAGKGGGRGTDWRDTGRELDREYRDIMGT